MSQQSVTIAEGTDGLGNEREKTLVTTRLPREDMAVLREAVERQRPALLPLLDTMYHAPLTLEQRSALRAAVSDEFVDTGLVRGTQPNNRGVFLETLIDYLAHV